MGDNGTPENGVAEKISSKLRKKRKRGEIKRAAAKSIIITAYACIIIIAAVLIYNNRNNWALFQNAGKTAGAAAKIGGPIDIIAGNTAEYASFAKGVAVVTTSSVRYATLDGSDGFIIDADFSRPTVSAAGGMLLAYDKSGTGLLVTDTKGRHTLAQGYGDTISAHINKKGYVSVFSEANGYKCALSAYDKNLNMRYRWKTSEYYGVASVVSEDGRTCAAAVVCVENGSMVGRIVFFNLEKEGIAETVDLGGQLPLDIWETDSGFFTVTDGYALSLDFDGNVKGRYNFGNGKIAGYVADKNGGVFIAVNSESASARYELVHLDSKAQQTGRRPIISDVFSISSCSGLLAVHNGTGIDVYDEKLNLKRIISPDGKVEKVVIISDGIVVIVTADEVLTA